MDNLAELSETQRGVLAFVTWYIAEHGLAPTMRAIGAGVKIPSLHAVDFHLRSLAKQGYIARDRVHGIRVLKSA